MKLTSRFASLGFGVLAASCSESPVAPKEAGTIGGGSDAGDGSGFEAFGGSGGTSGAGGAGGTGGDAGPSDTIVVDFVYELASGDYYNADMVYTDECNPVTQDCATGKRCDWACPERAFLCKPEPQLPDGGGTFATHGQECGTTTLCAKGHFCSLLQGHPKPLCQKYCGAVDKNPDCPPPKSGGSGFCELRSPACAGEIRQGDHHLCEI